MTMLKVPYGLGQLGVTGTPDKFERIGFTVSTNGLIGTFNGALAFSGNGDTTSFIGIGVDGPDLAPGINLEGIPVINTDTVPPVDHRNGCYELDHMVIMTPDLDTTVKHVEAVLQLRQLRLRDSGQRRQSFHRFADVTHPDGTVSRGCILEVVETDKVDTTRLWGVVFNTTKFDRVVQGLPEAVISEPRAAVQKGRRIASFKPKAGLGIAVALMTPPVRKERQAQRG